MQEKENSVGIPNIGDYLDQVVSRKVLVNSALSEARTTLDISVDLAEEQIRSVARNILQNKRFSLFLNEDGLGGKVVGEENEDHISEYKSILNEGDFLGSLLGSLRKKHEGSKEISAKELASNNELRNHLIQHVESKFDDINKQIAIETWDKLNKYISSLKPDQKPELLTALNICTDKGKLSLNQYAFLRKLVPDLNDDNNPLKSILDIRMWNVLSENVGNEYFIAALNERKNFLKEQGVEANPLPSLIQTDLKLTVDYLSEHMQSLTEQIKRHVLDATNSSLKTINDNKYQLLASSIGFCAAIYWGMVNIQSIEQERAIHSMPISSLIEQDLVNYQDRSGSTALHRASNIGNQQDVDDLIKAGANVDIKDDKGYTPIHIATEKGHTEIVRKLIAANANIDTRAIYKAIYWGPVGMDAPQGGIEYSAHKPGMIDNYFEGQTPLHIAVRLGNLEIVNLLINAGADQSITNMNGKTPAQLATKRVHQEVARKPDSPPGASNTNTALIRLPDPVDYNRELHQGLIPALAVFLSLINGLFKNKPAEKITPLSPNVPKLAFKSNDFNRIFPNNNSFITAPTKSFTGLSGNGNLITAKPANSHIIIPSMLIALILKKLSIKPKKVTSAKDQGDYFGI